MEFLSLLDDDHKKHLKNLQETAISSSSISSSSKYSLHTAALLGHHESIKQLVKLNPELSKSVDSNGSSALHLASAKGHAGIANELVSVNSSMCYVLDGDGRSPLHLAAIKGRTAVLGELLRTEPEAAAVLTGRGESCLHLCVMYNRLEAMKVIWQYLKRDDRLLDWKDEEGNTVLHLAVARKQIEIVKYLLNKTRIEPHLRNANGLTPLDLLLQNPGDLRDLQIKQYLENKPKTIKTTPSLENQLTKTPLNKKHKHTDWLARKRNALMIVASLLATVAFQAGLSPPGGVWQDDFSGNLNGTTRANKPHKAGQSVMAYTLPSKYGQYMIFNTIAFLASLSIILLQVSGLPMRRRRWMWTQMVTMWIAVSAQTLTYFVAFVSMTPKHVEGSVYHVTRISVVVWLLLIGLVFVGNVSRAVLYLLRKYGYVERKETESLGYEEDEEEDGL